MAKAGYALHPEAAQRLAIVLATGLDLHAIQSMGRDELLELQEKLGYGREWGRWIIPEGWAPKSGKTRFRCLTVNTPKGDRIWKEAIQFVLLLTLTPSRHEKRNTILMPTSVLQKGEIAVRMGKVIAEEAGSDARWWSRLRLAHVKSHTERYFAKALIGLCERGLVADAPPEPIQDDAPTERDRYGEGAQEQAEDSSQEWQPLPDLFVAKMGRCVLWMTQEVGPSLLECFEACIDLKLPPAASLSWQKLPGQRAKKSESNGLSKLRGELIRSWRWTAQDGSPLALPVDKGVRLNFKQRKGFVQSKESFLDFAWPPQSWGDITKLVVTLQACHAWLLFLATGPRASTLVDYTTACLIPGPNGYRLAGTQWKNTRERGGQRRDWPLPPVLVKVVTQQILLASLMKRLARPDDPESLGKHLWVQIGQARGMVGAPLTGFNHSFKQLPRVFGLQDLLDLDGSVMHTHRFRKTLARILALALTSAQIVLMDTFGHDDPDQTIGYMLSDKAIVADVMRMQREIVILLAVDAIKDADNLGGAFGDVVREKVHAFRRIKGSDALEPKDMYELADQLTLGGRDWVPVMEGVICTMDRFDHGPCGEGKGLRRDPLNCQAGCTHQLILAYHKNMCDDRIDAIVPLLERANEEQNELLIAELTAKLMNHLFRWREVYEKWREHPLIRKLVQGKNMWWDKQVVQAG
ncbi:MULTISPECIES: hypothetical protein [Rhodanobacter]|nr:MULTISPECIES: hypothetical protein [Rhodanobacter]UJM86309.1 hypothetical protein LRJ86_16240 [Rhodanobacter denitrificans]UJM90248.1 hypothetical protein LRK24_17765 [Rhodanobacter denitrificans]UJM93776.1 hypothetical protein LRK32_17710 [Rhodanobacter denitrificans]UJM97307.1 hypothetical protein LRK44_17720 [Rhodanobacter denitrificans]UJN23278.1 hypothetical protein LRK54_08915 [Rhodanobacter denitrificans]